MKIISSGFITLLALLSLVSSFGDAQTVAACTQDGDTLCADENKVCISTTTTTAEPATIKETCEECLDGFIEFRNVCINIENALALEDFVEEFTPVFINGSATPAERLTRLIALAKIISALNARVPPPPFTLGLNKYSADSEEERATLAGYIASLESAGDFPRFDPTTEGGFRKLQQEDLPATVNWKEMDATTIVKDQGRCGSCWALSLAATIESAAFINPDNEGFLQSFSFQQFISCNDLGINNGCGGGNTIIGMGYAALNTFGGLTSLNDYPYTDAKGDTTEQCKLEGKNVTARVERPRIVMSYDDELSFDERVVKMKEAVSRQPVSVNMKSSCDQFSSYKKGVMTDDGGCACQSVTCIDHAIVLVGYDDTADNPYWLLRNSWGANWGESGHFRIGQNDGTGRYGLFGMLGEGVIALDVFNTTAAVDDQYSEGLETWALALIIAASALGACLLGGLILKLIPKSKQ